MGQHWSILAQTSYIISKKAQPTSGLSVDSHYFKGLLLSAVEWDFSEYPAIVTQKILLIKGLIRFWHKEYYMQNNCNHPIKFFWNFFWSLSWPYLWTNLFELCFISGKHIKVIRKLHQITKSCQKSYRNGDCTWSVIYINFPYNFGLILHGKLQAIG